MKHEVKVRFPASSDLVIKAFADKDFHTGELEQMGISDYTVEDYSFDGEGFAYEFTGSAHTRRFETHPGRRCVNRNP